MEPTPAVGATLADLLDRLLDKGVVIQADLIISVAGIPLIGVQLRAAIAGMETMLRYGLMEAFDQRTRAWAREALAQPEGEIGSECPVATSDGHHSAPVPLSPRRNGHHPAVYAPRLNEGP